MFSLRNQQSFCCCCNFYQIKLVKGILRVTLVHIHCHQVVPRYIGFYKSFSFCYTWRKGQASWSLEVPSLILCCYEESKALNPDVLVCWLIKNDTYYKYKTGAWKFNSAIKPSSIPCIKIKNKRNYKAWRNLHF